MVDRGTITETGERGGNFDDSPPNGRKKFDPSYESKLLSKLLVIYENGLKKDDLSGLDEAKAKTPMPFSQTILNALNGTPDSALALFQEHVECMDDVDRGLWIDCLSGDAVCIKGTDEIVMPIFTLLKEDEEDSPVQDRFYARGACGTGGAAGQINRVGPHLSTHNKNSALLNQHRINRQNYNLFAADRIEATVAELPNALAEGYRIIGFSLALWNNHIFNQLVFKNAYLPMHLSLVPAVGFVFTPCAGIRLLSPFDLARQAPTKSEMNIGGLNQCSASIHQAMLLGYAHSKQQVDCVDIEEVTPAAIGARGVVRIVWSPFQPVYSVVYEGVTTMIMSYFSEKNLFAMNPALAYNW